MIPSNSRREFIRQATLLAGSAALAGCSAPYVSRRRVLGANDRLNVACVAVGGKGWVDMNGVDSENLVGLCDVDAKNLAKAGEKFPGARRFADFREMFDQLGSGIDAVTVSTPDHMHFPPALRAIKEGKHVFCQKPLTHTVWEARELTLAARAAGVATQMGNQGISHPKLRRDADLVKAGVLGPIQEMHCWTDRPIWPQGFSRPAESKPVPPELSYDLWLGTAPARPYHPAWGHFVWRGWWDFGTGAIGDMGCHLLNLGALALDLSAPVAVEAESEGSNSETAPKSSHIVWDFPARNGQPAFKFHWYDGGKLPPKALFPGAKYDGNGVLVIGSQDTMLTNYEGGATFKSGRTYADFKSVPSVFPKYDNWDKCHYEEWIRACKGGPKAYSNFDVAGPVTETVLLGNVAIRTGRRIEWDSKKLRVTNLPEANRLIRTEYRPGWVG